MVRQLDFEQQRITHVMDEVEKELVDFSFSCMEWRSWTEIASKLKLELATVLNLRERDVVAESRGQNLPLLFIFQNACQSCRTRVLLASIGSFDEVA